MSQKEISLRVTVDEANLVMEGLGHIAFARVYALVAKLQEQAGQQLDDAPSNGSGAITSAPAQL